ncbi:hypothetical protein VTH82DRAFT_7508 [Thermothelomyces myriococcoides]
MTPRVLISALQLFSSVLAVTAGPTNSIRSDIEYSSHPRCKAVPGSPNWPSPGEWKRLNESLAGRLLRPTPPGAVCHSGEGADESPECTAVREQWSNYEFHQNDPVSVFWNNFANDTCLPFPGAPCSGQGYPVFVINATEPRHVQLGVQFAKKHNIRLVVKSTGHDYIGRSNAPNSLSIWTHHMKDIKTHRSFRLKGCNTTIKKPAVTVGAGTQMWDLYSALDRVNQTVVGGGGKTVSVGGYLTGAGHGLLAPTHGLGADQVIEMELVTPNGDIITANECQNEDIFWAMRGGGGSTFGVLTSISMTTFATPRIESVLFALTTTDLTDHRPIFDMSAYILSQFPSLGDQGLSGYSFIAREIPNPFDNSSTPIGGFLFSGAMENSSPEEMGKLWEPIIAHVNATWPGRFEISYHTTSFPTFLAWFAENYDSEDAGYDVVSGSRLLDREALTANLTALSAAYERFVGPSASTAFLVSGKGVHNARPRGRDGNAVLPAWRSAYVHSTCGEAYPPFNATAAAIAQTLVRERVDALRELAPNMGAYMNEANPEEPNWQKEFWGANYERLRAIKRAVDPDDVLWCTPCVGNERWEQVDDRLCRVEGSD